MKGLDFKSPNRRARPSRVNADLSPRASVSSANDLVDRQQVQRRSACACGGGCPRCVQSSEMSGAVANVASAAAIHQTAATGVRGAGTDLPHVDRIQAAFGRHDVTSVQAHVGAAAAQAAKAINAAAYTIAGHVAFDGQPDLFTAAHEAAHAVQQRGRVQLDSAVGRVGDRFEQHADAVAAEVAAGRSAETLLDQYATNKPPQNESSQHSVVQRQEAKRVKRAHTGIADAAIAAQVTATVDAGLRKIDEELIKGTKSIRLAIRNDAEFDRAWDDYCDRSGHSGARQGGELNGFVDPTHPNGKTGFVRASKGIDTVIHEAIHQRAHASFFPGKVGENVNEGTTELFTRIVIAYAGGTLPRTVYEHQKTAMLRFQGICGLNALAQWYFKGDISGVEKALGAKLQQFLEWMDGPGTSDVATRAQSAITVL